MPSTKLHIIGCGKLGKTLGRLWYQQQVFTIGALLCSNDENTLSAHFFINNKSEATLTRSSDFTQDDSSSPTPSNYHGDIVLIATPDHAIHSTCQQLVNDGRIDDSSIIFHCSGSLSSAILAPAKALGCAVCSIHPIHSFSSPERSVTQFAGSYCTYEGDEQALAAINPAFTSIGAQLLPITADSKTLYHAGLVLTSNYTVALMEASLQLFETAGIDRDTARHIMQPIAQDTLDNIFATDPLQALTGPIERRDTNIIASHLDKLQQENKADIQQVYIALGKIALQLAEQKHGDAHQKLDHLFPPSSD